MKELTPASPLTDEQALHQIEHKQKELRFLLPSYFVKLRYKLWLVALRETSIVKTLTEHYNEIPKGTFSKLIVLPFYRFKLCKNLLSKLERKLRRRIY